MCVRVCVGLRTGFFLVVDGVCAKIISRAVNEQERKRSERRVQGRRELLKDFCGCGFDKSLVKC